MGKLTPGWEELERITWQTYYSRVIEDYSGLKEMYPFSSLHILPTAKPSFATITVIAVNKTVIDAVNGNQEDFTGEYSKQLFLELPIDYRERGCKVYGGKWINKSKFSVKDIHLFHSNSQLIENKYGYQMCVGTPESFPFMKNVLLEAVKTAENMLVAYERVQCGLSDRVILNAYSHGEAGKEEYRKDKKRYVPR